MGFRRAMLIRLRDRLKKRDDQLDVTFYLPGKARAAAFAAARQRHGDLPAGLEMRYSQVAALSLSWRLQDPAHPDLRAVEGDLRWHRIDRLGPLDDCVWPDTLSHEERTRIERSLLVEALPRGGRVLVEPGDPERLWLYRFPGRFARLRVSLEDYCDLAARLGGLAGWQRYLCAPDELDLREEEELPDGFHEHLARLFPKIDRAVFRPASRADGGASMLPEVDALPGLRARLDAVARRLKEDPRVTKIVWEPNRGASIEVLRMARRTLGAPLPRDLVGLYFEMNGARLWWSAHDDALGDVEGSLDIRPLEEVFGGRDPFSKPTWGDDAMSGLLYNRDNDPTDVARMRGLRWWAPYEGASSGVALRFLEGRAVPVHYEKLDPSPLRVDLSGALEGLVSVGGMNGAARQLAGRAPGDERLIAAARSFFPDADLAVFGG